MAGIPDQLAAVALRVRHALCLQGHHQGRPRLLHPQREWTTDGVDSTSNIQHSTFNKRELIFGCPVTAVCCVLCAVCCRKCSSRKCSTLSCLSRWKAAAVALGYAESGALRSNPEINGAAACCNKCRAKCTPRELSSIPTNS